MITNIDSRGPLTPACRWLFKCSQRWFQNLCSALG